jgi:hypothetical protein
MKKYTPIYYLLFILLVMGAFASMAQNSYGLKVMGAVSFIFALVFIMEFIAEICKNESKDVFRLIETACLFLIAFIFGLRIFYIYFPYVEWLFGAAAILLMLVYGRKMIIRFQHFWPKNNLLAILVLVFHLGIILFLISLATVPFAPKLSIYAGVLAFALLIVFIFVAVFKRKFLVEGENVSAFKIAMFFKDHSIIIVSLFVLFSLYVGFNRIGMLPGIYSDEFPRAYFELVDKAGSRKEKPVDGRYKYDEFMEKYEQFLKHNKIED